MAALDLHAAANVTGCSRSTLKRALVAGRIVGRRDDRGRWRIDRAELARSSNSSGRLTSPSHSWPGAG